MKQHLIAIIVGVACVSRLSASASAGGDVNSTISPETKIKTDSTIRTNIISCASANTGQDINVSGITCNFGATMNGLGDLKEITIQPATPSYDVGRITKEKKISIALPKVGAQKRFTLTLTQPHSEDSLDKEVLEKQPMEVIFLTVSPDALARQNMREVQSTVKVYRRLRQEALWTEVVTANINKPIDVVLPVDVRISPNGKSFITVNGKEIPFNLGKALFLN